MNPSDTKPPYRPVEELKGATRMTLPTIDKRQGKKLQDDLAAEKIAHDTQESADAKLANDEYFAKHGDRWKKIAEQKAALAKRENKSQDRS